MIVRRIVVCVVTAALVDAGWTPASAQADRAKLAAAFADVDRLLTDFATQQNVPGAAGTMNCERGKLEVAMTLRAPYFFTYRISRFGPTSAP